MISCICATQNKLDLPVHCFWQQNFDDLELMVLHPNGDWPELRELMKEDPRIRSVHVPEEVLKGGAGRYNAGIEAAAGDYFAIWDSDDWHAPTRLRTQYEAIQKERKHGCLLYRLHLYDQKNHRGYVSRRRPWEGSLLLKKESLPVGGYPTDIVRGADTKMLSNLGSKRFVYLDRPDLYTYVLHGGNTCGSDHAAHLISNSSNIGEENTDVLLQQLKEAVLV